jgi:hypothetical protein
MKNASLSPAAALTDPESGIAVAPAFCEWRRGVGAAVGNLCRASHGILAQAAALTGKELKGLKVAVLATTDSSGRSSSSRAGSWTLLVRGFHRCRQADGCDLPCALGDDRIRWRSRSPDHLLAVAQI